MPELVMRDVLFLMERIEESGKWKIPEPGICAGALQEEGYGGCDQGLSSEALGRGRKRGQVGAPSRDAGGRGLLIPACQDAVTQD